MKHPREMERRLAGDVVRIGGAEYAGALPADRHVFLVGNLQQPTTYPFIRDERVEVVLVSYRAGDDGRYHWHPDVTEYELVVEGEIGYFEVASGVTHWFGAGDFVAIPAGACVKRMVRAPARYRRSHDAPTPAGASHPCDVPCPPDARLLKNPMAQSKGSSRHFRAGPFVLVEGGA